MNCSWNEQLSNTYFRPSRLLEKFKIFNLYYRLSELRSRDDIVKKIITSMDYNLYVLYRRFPLFVHFDVIN